MLATQLRTLIVQQTHGGTVQPEDHPDQGAIEFATPEDVYADPCHRLSGLLGIGPSVDDLVAGLESGLKSVPGLRVSSSTSATVGGLPAQRITATDAGDSRLDNCDLAEVLLWADPNGGGTVKAGGNSLLNLYVLDVHGTRVLIVLGLSLFAVIATSWDMLNSYLYNGARLAAEGSGELISGARDALVEKSWIVVQ